MEESTQSMTHEERAEVSEKTMDEFIDAIRNLQETSFVHLSTVKSLAEMDLHFLTSLGLLTQSFQDVGLTEAQMGKILTNLQEAVPFEQPLPIEEESQQEVAEIRRLRQEVEEITADIRRARPRFERLRDETRAILDQLEAV